MNALHVLAWIIGACNPLSALLVGPALAQFLVRHGRARWVAWAQNTGWLVLAAAQVSFIGFGWISGYGGFKWAQALMVPAALLNFTAGVLARRRERDPVAAMVYAIKYAEGLGLVEVREAPGPVLHIADIGRLRDGAMDINALTVTGPWPEADEDDPQTGRHAMTEETRARVGTRCEVEPCERPVAEGEDVCELHRGYDPDETVYELDATPTPVPCPEPVYDRLSLGPPSPCALEQGHSGDCEP